MIIAGAALMAWAAYAALRPPPLPYDLTFSQTAPSAFPEAAEWAAGAESIERLEVKAKGVAKPVAAGLVTRDKEGRLTPLGWENSVTEPVFFADVSLPETAKALAAIEKHVPSEAVVLAWWDLSRRIRAMAHRQAPLDDPLAQGLLIPPAWKSSETRIREKLRGLWGSGVSGKEGSVFNTFIDALLLDEHSGAQALAKLANGKKAYIAVHLSDVWKAAQARPGRISAAWKDFPGTAGSHGVIKAVHQWIEEQKIEGGYAVEPMGNATRLHYFLRKPDSGILLAQLLPFSTSNPLRPGALQLVYQQGGYWIYALKAGNR
ncbi:MAG TPA: hydroxylamine oxidation protein HaoB [Methylocella sp.]|nr:hydroxylamine oxidation protein HaoB [Methylocella sp.]